MLNYLAETSGGGSFITLILPFALMFVIFYFLLIRPQQKKQKSRNLMLLNMSKGDKVVTIGGMHGTIVELSDETVILRVNDATKLTFERSAINAIKESKDHSAESS